MYKYFLKPWALHLDLLLNGLLSPELQLVASCNYQLKVINSLNHQCLLKVVDSNLMFIFFPFEFYSEMYQLQAILCLFARVWTKQ